MSSVDTVLKDYKVHVAEMLKLRADVSEKIKGSINELFKEFFNNNPEFLYVTWTQYTPYFNDGETCEFSVHDKWFVTTKSLQRYHGIADDDTEELEDMEQVTGWAAEEAAVYISSYRSEDARQTFIDDYGPRGSELFDAAMTLQTVLDSIPDEIYLDAFDDHAQVVVNKDGIEVEEYSHD